MLKFFSFYRIGQFQNDKANGHGVFFYKDGSKYEGEWKDGLKHGKGIDFYSNGKK